MFRFSPAHSRRHQPPFWFIYILSITFAFHALLVAFSNSTYMEQFTSATKVGVLYTISSAISVVLFLHLTHILKRLGNLTLTLTLSAIQIIALFTLAFSHIPWLSIAAFMAFLITNPLLFLCIDLFSESLIGTDEGATGSKKGLTLALMSIAAVSAPLALGIIVGGDNGRLWLTYVYSGAIFSIFTFCVFIFFKHFKDPKYREHRLRHVAQDFWKNSNIRNVIFCHFFLQVFFSWAVIYIPLYLATELNFGWDIIGSIIAAGMFAYVVFEYPIGYIADKWLGEKEMMAVGFTILIISIAAISAMGAASVFAWMLLMFFNRTGVSFVEVTTESYFFKQIDGSNPQILSLFRLTRPLAVLVGAALGTVTLFFLPYSLAFIVLAIFMLPAFYTTSRLEDTK